MKPSSYEKRVKRRIIGRDHSFFVSCSPGLKQVCLNEMQGQISNLSSFPEDNISVIQGGIEFIGKLNSCVLLNLNLRSPSKILMRINSFKADSFKKLEKKINAIDWILYLPKNCHLKFNVTARKSRLYHSDAIAQRCEKIILDQIRSGSGFDGIPGKISTQTIYVRVEDDNFTVSLDSTGELLFKRGLKQKVTQAPLRENLAFAMLFWAGFSKEDILIDPMCGSGTFSLEAAMIKSCIPPGFFRSFAFENWPGFSPKAYSHIKKQAQENFTHCSAKQIFASDIDEMALTAMEQNISHSRLNPVIDVSKTDFFTILPSMISPEKKGVVMLNPPYGKRLGEKSDTRSFYREIGKKLAADFKGWRFGIILPSGEYKSSLGLKLELKPIYHGGLDIFAGIGII
ncbi:THUMP domain-containing class I SAM-dependent RNA methyltransferase [Desulfobacula toluolica]|uniref:Putative RNA methylase n=1 Tax=Desulfobacula toluolica (strain DSM 7467 / Tol2) TaxID=651182 RepID=K0NGG0_DESTT|nr:RNA methyltransferase [Desulfobacula toluolica]CCK78913.1 putative RNA methylase [Desulfobacula toluolica Tol2]